MRLKRSSAFTLIELLVVLVIIGVLISFAVPSVTHKGRDGQMTGALSNGRQLHIATQSLDLDNFTEDKLSGWPGLPGKSVSTSVETWTKELMKGGYLTGADLKRLLSAPGIGPSGTNNFTVSAIAFHVYQVATTEDNGVIFLSTANWDATNPKEPGDTDRPYGKKGFVIIRKGGDGQIYQHRFGNQSNSTNIISGTQPPKLP